MELSGKNIPTSHTMNNDRSGGDKLYAVLYTSGSTGLPKVNMLEIFYAHFLNMTIKILKLKI